MSRAQQTPPLKNKTNSARTGSLFTGPPAPRRSGIPFERHTKAQLHTYAAMQLPSEPSPLDAAMCGATVYAWADAPASLLVDIGWEARDAHERRRVYEGPADKRGWREYGGDKLIERADVPGAIIIVQDKDHAVLGMDVLGRFLSVAQDAHELNTSMGLPRGTPSALLCYPNTTHITGRDKFHLGKWQPRIGLHQLSFDFEPTPGAEPGATPSDDPLEPSQPHKRLALVKTSVASSTASVGATADDADDADDAALYAAARPKGAKDRRFQSTTANAIVDQRGLHLVKAPPGCGKTAIVALVVGRLITPLKGTRNTAPDAKPMVAFLTAPYIDHVTQLKDRLGGVLKQQFGPGWNSIVELVADDHVPSAKQLKARLDAGARVFLSTDHSAPLLLALARHAQKRGHPILSVKDEAHYNSGRDAASTQLLALGDVGVACTATPDGDVIDMPDLKLTLQFPLDEAITKGWCANYRVILPLVTTVEEHLPIEAADLAREHRLGAAALFVVHGMLHDGGRRAIAYARDVAEAKALVGFLECACAFHGVACEAKLVIESTNDRQEIYAAFQTGATYVREARAHGQPDVSKPTLRFLVAVCILDQCVDLPKCDSILVASPPTSRQDTKSAHRAIQRIGRATRPDGGKHAHAYIFSENNNPWLQQLFDVLTDFDPGCRARVRVRSSNPATAFTKEAKALEHTRVEELVERFDVGGKRHEDASAYKVIQIKELARIVRLVHANAADPRSGKPARMPLKIDKRLGLGSLWDDMKQKGRRLDELRAVLVDFDLDAFITSQKTERVVPDYTKEEQIAALARLVRLVHTDAVDTESGNPARMPVMTDKRLALGNLWNDMKSKGRRIDELRVALADLDLDAFVTSQKKERTAPDYTKEEQIAALAHLVRLVHSKAVDAQTGKPARMPLRSDKRLGLGNLWNNMKGKGDRIDELRAVLVDDDLDLDAFITSQKTAEPDYTKDAQIVELARLVRLVHATAVDPESGNPAHMPPKTDKRLGLGNLWTRMKRTGGRLDELRAVLVDDDLDVDAFVASQRRKFKATGKRAREEESESESE